MKKTLQRFIAVASLCMAMLTAAHAQTLAGPNRPSFVPASYVLTPFGYFHPSCVAHLAQGDELRRDDKTIRHADGTTTPMNVCAYARYRQNGDSVFGDEHAIAHPDVNGYTELVSVISKGSYGSLSAQWSVPPTPAADDGQTIYIFPGLEDYKNTVTILQPVLGWNSDYKSAWGIASWNCCENGTVYEAPSERVSTGDTIFGYMYQTCAKQEQPCPTWNVLTQDLRTGKSSTLSKTSSFGQTFDWAFAGALEVYNVTQCADYPTTNAYPGGNTISMNNLSLFNRQLLQVANPGWQVSANTPGLSPNCHYGASVLKQVNLNN